MNLKFCLFAISVSLLAAQTLPAQSPGDSLDPLARMQRETLANLARAFDFNNALYDTPHSSLTANAHGQVVSLRALEHPVNKHARKIAARAMREYARHNYEDALSLFEEAARMDPGDTNLENNLGVAYSALGDERQAQRAFERAIEADPYSAVSISNLAAAAFNTNQYALAEQSARHALSLSPVLSEAKVTLAIAQIAQGRWTEEARFYLEENRSRVPQAETILRHWPRTNAEGKAYSSGFAVEGASRAVSSRITR